VGVEGSRGIKSLAGSLTSSLTLTGDFFLESLDFLGLGVSSASSSLEDDDESAFSVSSVFIGAGDLAGRSEVNEGKASVIVCKFSY